MLIISHLVIRFSNLSDTYLALTDCSEMSTGKISSVTLVQDGSLLKQKLGKYNKQGDPVEVVSALAEMAKLESIIIESQKIDVIIKAVHLEIKTFIAPNVVSLFSI